MTSMIPIQGQIERERSPVRASERDEKMQLVRVKYGLTAQSNAKEVGGPSRHRLLVWPRDFCGGALLDGEFA